MKIDLHCHTKATKNGDPSSRNINPSQLREKVIGAGVGLIAITNHNQFDLEQYQKIVRDSANEFMVWPGIELDIHHESQKGHVVLVVNPEEAVEFNKRMNEIIKDTSPDEFSMSSQELIELSNDLDCIILAHYIKSKSLPLEVLQEVKDGIIDNYRFFYEPSDFRTMGVLINHEYSSIVGSDVKNWDEYDKLKFSSLKLKVDSFLQFLKLAKKDIAVVETLLNSKSKELINISGKSGQIKNIDIFDDVNIIFGGKGTGKTYILRIIEEHFKTQGLSVCSYAPSEADENLKSKLIINDAERKLINNGGFSNKEEKFLKLQQWTDEKVTQMKDYLDHHKDKKVIKNKQRMKILTVDLIRNDGEELVKGEFENLDLIKSIVEEYKKLSLDDYLSPSEIMRLEEINQKLKAGISNKVMELFAAQKAINFTNKCVEKYIKEVDSKTETKSLPISTGLYNFAKNKFELEIEVNSILAGFDYYFDEKKEEVGLLEKNKNLEIIKKCNMLSNSSKRVEFSNILISKLKDCKKKLEEIQKKCYSEEIAKVMTELQEITSENNIKSLDDFLGVIKCFSIDGMEYTPSTGEATMITLQEKLNEDSAVYILDEPEKSLGNGYVNDLVVDKINELARNKKYVVVATHNGNIAIRTLPFTSIYKKYKNGVYETYAGSPFINKLIKIDGPETLDWKETSLKVLEGGKDAFEERGEIYGVK